MTITDEERREVASRLRKNAENCPNISLILNVAFADDALRPNGAMDWTVTAHDAAMRLADLIEPAEGHFAEGDKMVDREALLKLADEITEVRDALPCEVVNWDYKVTISREMLDNIVNRIREACGEGETK